MLVLGVMLVAREARAPSRLRALRVGTAAVRAQRLAYVGQAARLGVPRVAGALVGPRAVRVQTAALARGHAACEHILDEALAARAHPRRRAVAAHASALAVRRA